MRNHDDRNPRPFSPERVEQPGNGGHDVDDIRLANALDAWLSAYQKGQTLPAGDVDPRFVEILQHLTDFATSIGRQSHGTALNDPLETRVVNRDVQGDAGARGMPDKIGKYLIRDRLGAGGQAKAFLAFDPDLERHVVLKVFHAAQTPEQQEKVLQEGKALAKLESAYVVRCLTAERHEGGPYLVMEYLRGESLREVMKRKRFSIPEALRLVADIAAGLADVHSAGLVHRDVKPDNVILADDGRPRLVDFGLATHLGSVPLSEISGTLAYMAPEQARGEPERITPRTDIFGLGGILYELLTGRPPYVGSTPSEVLSLVRRGEITPVRQIRPDVPEAVAQLCERCLAAAPSKRPDSAAQLRTELLRLADELEGRRHAPVQAKQPRWAQYLPWGLAACAAGAIVAWIALSPSRPPASPRPEPPAPSPSSSAAVVSPTPIEQEEPFFPRDLLPAAFPTGEPLVQDFAVDVRLEGATFESERGAVLRAGQEVKLVVRPERDCFVRVLTIEYVGEIKDVPDRIVQLFPNDAEPDHWVRAGQVRVIPGRPTVAGARQQRIVASPSKGPEYLLIVASTGPWELPAGQVAGVYKLFTKREAIQNLQAKLRSLELQSVDENGSGVELSEVLIPYVVVPSPIEEQR